jgi:hypothetical protein
MTLNSVGCSEKVIEFLDSSSDLLFVVGFCIIVFMKGCFLAILRYEIKEMIQKIKLLNGDDGGQTAMNELIGLTTVYDRGNTEDPGEREGLMAASVNNEHGVQETNIDAIESDNRKDSVISRDHHNCLGNHVNHRRAPNHIGGGGGGSNNTPPNTTTTTAIISGCGPSRRQDSCEDERPAAEAVGRKFRNENGGRSVPRNGNNNTTGVGGVTGSASAPIPIDSMAKA